MSAGTATALDAALLLGLIGKAEEVFARPEHVLSYPLSLWALDPAELDAAVNDPTSKSGSHGAADFADLVNSIPTGRVWQPHQGTRLWDVHGDVLAADLAEGTRTPKEEVEYQQAFDVLKVADGTLFVDSSAVVEYEQCRDAYITAVQEFKNRQGRAESSDDPAVAAAWEADRSRLQQVVDEADEAWSSQGHRSAVETARRTLRDIGSRSPVRVWAGYRQLFDPNLEELFFMTGPAGRYVPTGYIPADVVDSVWASMTLTRQDMAALAARAPTELRDRLGASPLDDDVVALTLEYSTITPHRPWFTPAPYHLRCWRFHDSNRLLSDGQSPPHGECPAYVTGVVLVRNLALERLAPAPRSTATVSRPTRRTTSASRPRRRVVSVGRTRSKRRTSVDRRKRSGITAVVREAASRVRRATSAREGRVRDHRRRPSPGREPRPPAPPATRVMSRRRVAAPPPPPPRSERIGGDEIYVLAFECSPFPRCPDPDLGLLW